MKIVFLLLTIVALSACTTLANRRDLYRPKGADGPYTQRLHGEEPAAASSTVTTTTTTTAPAP